MDGKLKFTQDHNDEAGPSSSVEELHHEIPIEPIYKGESSGAKNQLGENDPHPKDQPNQTNVLVINKLFECFACLKNNILPPSL